MHPRIKSARRFQDAFLRAFLVSVSRVLERDEAAPLLLVRQLVVMAIASSQVLAFWRFSPITLRRVAIVDSDAGRL